MKKLLLLTALLSAPSLADEYCQAVYKQASIVMQLRQADVPMFEVVETMKTGYEPTDNATLYMITQAYNVSSHKWYKQREAAVRKFANEIYYQCMKGRK